MTKVTTEVRPLRKMVYDRATYGATDLYGAAWAWSAITRLENGTYKQITPWASCKDYFNEFMWSQYSKQPTYVSGPYDPKKKPYDVNALRIGIMLNQGANNEARCKSSLKVIRAVEESLGLKKKCRLRRLVPADMADKTIKNPCFVFEANKYWLKAPPLSSLFMTIVRGCRNYNEKKHGSDPLKFLFSPNQWRIATDASYMRRVISHKLLKPLITQGSKLFFHRVASNYNIKCHQCGNHIPTNPCCKNRRYDGLHGYGVSYWSYMSKANFERYIYKGAELYEKRTKAKNAKA